TSRHRDARVENLARPSQQDEEASDDAAIYSQRSEGVSSPIAVRPQLPRQLSPDVNRSDLRVIELVISPTGSVESVRLIGAPRDVHDSMLLSAAKAWVFRPAEKNGVPVRYRKTVSVAPRAIANMKSSLVVRRRAAVWAMALFSVTIFLGSSLLFLVQPMFAKVALPWLGGSPSVWNTCILFFQTTLLLGYLYAHLSTRWLGVRRQIYGHVILVLAPLIVLPLTAGGAPPPASANPVWWLLRTMTVRVGLPFFVVSTSAPLLQRWFATLPVPSARDPYFLYSASNLGSMIALLGYPFVLEPT